MGDISARNITDVIEKGPQRRTQGSLVLSFMSFYDHNSFSFSEPAILDTSKFLDDEATSPDDPVGRVPYLNVSCHYF